MIGVYKIANRKNGWSYIGSSKSIENRWKQHISELEEKKHHCYRLQYDWDKYGICEFDFSVLEICDESNLIQREQYYIDLNYNNGMIYNTKLKLENSFNKAKSNESRSRKLDNKHIFIPKAMTNIPDSINAQRLLLYILSSIKTNNHTYFEISVKEYCEVLNMSNSRIYIECPKYVQELRNVSVEGSELFNLCEYNKGIIIVNVKDNIFKLLNKNNSLKIKINIQDLSKIISSNTLKVLIYILTNYDKISLDKFRDILDIKGSTYNEYGNLKMKVIKRIVDDAKNMNIDLKVNEYKIGKKIDSLKFTI